MVVIWGLDMKELQWSKFKSSYMFKNRDYHLRRTKFAVYQIAMISCVVSESLGTAALSDYIDQQKFINSIDNAAVEYNDDYVGVASYNIFVGIYVATIFGGAFFFDLFWPERREDHGVKVAWRACSVFACLLALAAAVAETVLVSSHSATVTGVDAARARELLRMFGGTPPLRYAANGRAVASLVFAWIGVPAVIASTVVMWMSLAHIDKHGPFSSHSRKQASPSVSPATDGAEMGGMSEAKVDEAPSHQPDAPVTRPDDHKVEESHV